MSSTPTSPNRKIVIPKGTLNPNETTVLRICNSVPKNQNISTAGDRRLNRSLPENFRPTDAQGFKPPNFLTRKEGSPIISRCPASRPDYSSSMVDSSLEDDSMALFGNQGGAVLNRDQKDMYNKIVIPVKTPWEPVQQYRYGEREGFAPCSCSSLVEGRNLQMEDANDISAVQESTFNESDLSQSFPTGSSPGEITYSDDSGEDAFYSAQSQLAYITCPSSTPRKENLTTDRRNNEATFNSSNFYPPPSPIQADNTFGRRCSDSVPTNATFDSSKKGGPAPLANSTFISSSPNQTFNTSNGTNGQSPSRNGAANNATFNTQPALNRTTNAAADATFNTPKKRDPCPLANSTFNAGAPNQTFDVSNDSANKLANATFNAGPPQRNPNQTFNMSNGSANNGANATFIRQPAQAAADATFNASKKRGPCPLANSTFNAGDPNQTFNVPNDSGNQLANATFNAGPPQRNPNQTFNVLNGSANNGANATFIRQPAQAAADATFNASKKRGPCPLANSTFNAGDPNQTFNVPNDSGNQLANATFNAGPPQRNPNQTFNVSNGSANNGANATFIRQPAQAAADATFNASKKRGPCPLANSTFNAGDPNQTFNVPNDSGNQLANATFNAGPPQRNPNQTFNVSNGSANRVANATFNAGSPARNPNQTFNVSNGSGNQAANATFNVCPSSRNPNQTFNVSNGSANQAANATFNVGPPSRNPNETFNISNRSNGGVPCPSSNMNRTFNAAGAANATFDMTPRTNGNNGGISDQTSIKPKRPCPLKDQSRAMASGGNQGRSDSRPVSRNRDSRSGGRNDPCPATKQRNVKFQK